MNSGEAVCQVPLTWPLRVSRGLPKDFGLFRSGSREGEPGREKMIDSMVLRRLAGHGGRHQEMGAGRKGDRMLTDRRCDRSMAERAKKGAHP